jgi:hypothetical protein
LYFEYRECIKMFNIKFVDTPLTYYRSKCNMFRYEGLPVLLHDNNRCIDYNTHVCQIKISKDYNFLLKPILKILHKIQKHTGIQLLCSLQWWQPYCCCT